MVKRLMALMALMILTACDYNEKQDIRREHDSAAYRSSMTDYHAGRMDAAVAGLEKAVSADPSNASARFQLACLLQDYKKDFLGAYCGYLEYLRQQPASDKAAIARERLAICEPEVAKVLASKHGLNENAVLIKKIEVLKGELKESATRIAALESDLATARNRVVTLDTERERLIKAVKSDDAEDELQPSLSKGWKDEKAILEEEDMQSEIVSRDNVKTLKSEEQEELSSGSTILPERKVDDLAKRAAKEQVKDDAAAALREYQARHAHPDTYVVQDGDTLYRIAIRFYGKISAWKRIRDANKAIISTDGRVRSGETIKLP